MTALSATEFSESWKEDLDPLVTAAPGVFEDLSLPADTIEFLTHAGLPASVAPFLSFNLDSARLDSASVTWGLDAKFNNHLVIGSNGSGDPVCLVQPSGDLVYLNHDDRFKETLINSSVPQFAACCLIFRELLRVAIAQNGEEAALDNNIPIAALRNARNQMAEVDPRAISPRCFWHDEFEQMAAGPW